MTTTKRFVELIPDITKQDRAKLGIRPTEDIVKIRAAFPRDTVDRMRYWETRRNYKPYLRPSPEDATKLALSFHIHPPMNDNMRKAISEAIYKPPPAPSFDLKPIPALETLKVLMQGLLPNRGRNEKEWVQVDAETKKLRQVTTTESNIHLYFRAHILAEQQLLHAIVDFL